MDRFIRMLRPLLLAITLLLSTGAPAHALVVGIGDQNPSFMSDQRFLALGMTHVRIVVPYDVTDFRGQTAVLEQWLGKARASNYDILVTFARSRDKHRNDKLPSLASYRKRTGEFMRRYPFVTNYVPWNEPNLCSSRTCHNPRAAARFYLSLRGRCQGCNVLAADLVDSDNMVSWVKEYQHYTHGRPKLWGLHNYVDANAGTSRRTRAMLRATSGEVWFTETGGIVQRWKKNVRKSANRTTAAFATGIKPAARATKHVFTLARISPRIKRVYLYHWRQDRGSIWDSAFIDGKNHARPSLEILQRELSKLHDY